MAAREYVVIVKESALNTVMGSPTDVTDKIAIRLIDGNAFGMTTAPIVEEIPVGMGLAIPGEAISDHYECKGQLRTKFYPSQAPFLLNWALTRINAGQTLPWVTSEPPGDLASASVYHAVARSDGSIVRKRYSGCKVAGIRIEISRGGTSGTLTLDLQACRCAGNKMENTNDPDGSEFGEPAGTLYGTGPYTFRSTAGGFLIDSIRTDYESLAIAVQNALDGRWFENYYLGVNQFCGRASTLDAALRLKASPDDRTKYEQIGDHTVSVTFNNSVNSCTIDFKGKNYITKLPFDLPLNAVYMRPISLKNKYDFSASNDITVSTT